MTFQVAATMEFITKLQALPPEQQQQVLDFVDFLTQKYSHAQPVQKRVLGLNRGDIWISDDFNDPLPDEFWMDGQSE